jgi:hypothetical protein
VSLGSKRGEYENMQESMAVISHGFQNYKELSLSSLNFLQDYLILQNLTMYIWYLVTILALITVSPKISVVGWQ